VEGRLGEAKEFSIGFKDRLSQRGILRSQVFPYWCPQPVWNCFNFRETYDTLWTLPKGITPHQVGKQGSAHLQIPGLGNASRNKPMSPHCNRITQKPARGRQSMQQVLFLKLTLLTFCRNVVLGWYFHGWIAYWLPEGSGPFGEICPSNRTSCDNMLFQDTCFRTGVRFARSDPAGFQSLYRTLKLVSLIHAFSGEPQPALNICNRPTPPRRDTE
jgi:hypothetical protein